LITGIIFGEKNINNNNNYYYYYFYHRHLNQRLVSTASMM
jgi:hypothetical protein